MKTEIPAIGDAVVNAEAVVVGNVLSIAGTGSDGYLVFLDDTDCSLVELHEDPYQHLPARTWRRLRVLL